MSIKILIGLLFIINIVVCDKNPRIAGGTDSKPKEFPYLISIKRISDNEHVCGGAILSTRHVVTSAQCVDNKFVEIADLVIRAGTTKEEINDSYLSGFNFGIEKIFKHPEYKETLTPDLLHHSNIAIIKTSRPFEINYSLNIIELSTTDIEIGKIGVVSGWGKRVHPIDPNPKQVRKAWMMIVNTQTCEKQLNLRILSDQFCVFQSRGVGACIGDSGSPLVIDNKLVGIVSLFEPCATGIPDVYTKIYSHLDFIRSMMNL